MISKKIYELVLMRLITGLILAILVFSSTVTLISNCSTSLAHDTNPGCGLGDCQHEDHLTRGAQVQLSSLCKEHCKLSQNRVSTLSKLETSEWFTLEPSGPFFHFRVELSFLTLKNEPTVSPPYISTPDKPPQLSS